MASINEATGNKTVFTKLLLFLNQNLVDNFQCFALYPKQIKARRERVHFNLFLKFSSNALAYTDRMLNLYSNLVSANYSLGDYQSALTFARKGIEIGNKSNNFELIADLYYNNALVLSVLGYEKDAELSYLKSLELSQIGSHQSKGLLRRGCGRKHGGRTFPRPGKLRCSTRCSGPLH